MDCCPSCLARIESLTVNLTQAQREIRILQKQVETLWTPLWKRVWFRINGWPWYEVVERPKPRPWHRWTGI